jgi:hypothetical protein
VSARAADDPASVGKVDVVGGGGWHQAAAGTIFVVIEIYAASTRRKPFHIAVAAPEVKTGRIRTS